MKIFWVRHQQKRQNKPMKLIHLTATIRFFKTIKRIPPEEYVLRPCSIDFLSTILPLSTQNFFQQKAQQQDSPKHLQLLHDV